jgi:histidinol-phosphate/aromatic aminotransferase/cobyric acid decarboxylase-like protein/choline kinase
MKAIILAAGYGNRMRPFTDTLHKTLIDVNGRTVIGRIIDALLSNGVNDVAVVTGYRHEELTTFLKREYPKVAFTFVHNARYRETNNIYSMALAFEQITFDSDIILIESDLVIGPDVIAHLLACPHPNVALVDHFRSGMDGTVVTVSDGVVSNVIPPHLQPANFDFSDKFKTLNIYKFSREFCESSFKRLLTYYAKVIDANCYYELILGILIYMQRERIHAQVIAGQVWAEVDDPNDLRVVRYLFHPDRRQELNDTFGGYWSYDVVDFCFIRNMYFPSGAILSELKDALPSLLQNYGSRQSVLNRKLSWFLLCSEDRLLALNGASQIYPILANLLADKKALIPGPTFGEYPRLFPKAETYADNVGIDLGEVRHKTAGRDVVVFVNPNNPAGTELPTDQIYELAASTPGTLFIVDESFIEFSKYPSIVASLETKPLNNVLVIKSLSKSLGVPGVRLGFAYTCDSELRKRIAAQIPIWGMNSVAEFMLEIILKHRVSLARSLDQTKSDRQEFAAALAEVPMVQTVHPSGGNFLMVTLQPDAPEPTRIVDTLLNRHNMYIKDVSDKFGGACKRLRFAVRLPSENLTLVAKLKEL